MGVNGLISTVIYFEKAEVPVQYNRKTRCGRIHVRCSSLLLSRFIRKKILLTAQALDILFTQRLRVVLITHNHDWFIVIG